jgi:Tfp pilus tip-associated adhesin PilY1
MAAAATHGRDSRVRRVLWFSLVCSLWGSVALAQPSELQAADDAFNSGNKAYQMGRRRPTRSRPACRRIRPSCSTW